MQGRGRGSAHLPDSLATKTLTTSLSIENWEAMRMEVAVGVSSYSDGCACSWLSVASGGSWLRGGPNNPPPSPACGPNKLCSQWNGFNGTFISGSLPLRLPPVLLPVPLPLSLPLLSAGADLWESLGRVNRKLSSTAMRRVSSRLIPQRVRRRLLPRRARSTWEGRPRAGTRRREPRVTLEKARAQRLDVPGALARACCRAMSLSIASRRRISGSESMARKSSSPTGMRCRKCWATRMSMVFRLESALHSQPGPCSRCWRARGGV